MGYERRYNAALRGQDRQAFVAYMGEGQRVRPANMPNIVATNQGRRPLTGETPRARPLAPERVRELMARGHAVVDARSAAAFGSGHIVGAYHAQGSEASFAPRVGWIVPDGVGLILLAETPEDAQALLYRMAFVALDRAVAGYVEGGMGAWADAGLPAEPTPQMDVCELREELAADPGLRVLDVRDPDEWDEGHLEGARFMPYTSLVPRPGAPAPAEALGLGAGDPLAVMCGSGSRSSTAASLLLRSGYRDVRNVAGGLGAWKAAGYPVLHGAGDAG